ncbi:MAG TPA: methyltransferase domain-containing protein, partial [Pirellulales bacterium]|nr:methyltransferase domain-containing protein [Pirellulales bacterium]
SCHANYRTDRSTKGNPISPPYCRARKSARLPAKEARAGMLDDWRLFFREYLRNFHHTGAVSPSSRFLAAALARHVSENPGNGAAPRRVLEVGPGTGAVTRQIVASLGPFDRFDLVEWNSRFVDCLRRRFETEAPWKAVADRVRVIHAPVQDLPREGAYQAIVSGLPLNNFAVADVEQILEAFRGLLAPGGTLSFFEYIAVRPARALVSGRADRQRLKGIGQALEQILARHEFHRDCVWPNLPPAWVHHVRLS